MPTMRYSEEDVRSVHEYRVLKFDDTSGGRLHPMPSFGDWEIKSARSGSLDQIYLPTGLRPQDASLYMSLVNEADDYRWSRAANLSLRVILMESDPAVVLFDADRDKLAAKAESPIIVLPAGFVGTTQQYKYVAIRSKEV